MMKLKQPDHVKNKVWKQHKDWMQVMHDNIKQASETTTKSKRSKK